MRAAVQAFFERRLKRLDGNAQNARAKQIGFIFRAGRSQARAASPTLLPISTPNGALPRCDRPIVGGFRPASSICQVLQSARPRKVPDSEKLEESQLRTMKRPKEIFGRFNRKTHPSRLRALRAFAEAKPTMSGLLVKCAVLVVLIHAFRAVGRRVGPRYSALTLGLPSTTAVMLVLCAWERGDLAATRMAEANLLGLVAAVVLPLVYAQAVRLRCRLAPALLGAALAYAGIASLLASLPVMSMMPRLFLATAVILAASALAGRIADPPASWTSRASSSSSSRALFFRSLVPTIYVLLVVAVQAVAGPSAAGLASAFPSMSLVLLAVTHLEVGPCEASRVARYLPLGNLSTLAFLATFCWADPVVGLFRALFVGYGVSVVVLLFIDMGTGKRPLAPGAAAPRGIRISRQSSGLPSGFATSTFLGSTRFYAHNRLAPRRAGRGRPQLAHRGGFSPWVETLSW
jgi:hypothetical protein